jgi:MFS family permease
VAGSQYKWVVLAAGSLIGCVAMGAMFSLPIFLDPMTAATGWTKTGISSAMTLAFLSMAVASMVWGALSDRFGARPIVLTGGVLMAGTFALISQVNALWQFQLLFGGVLGLSIAAFFAPLMASVMGWFDTNRGLAVSLVSAGIGLAPVTMSPFVAWMLQGSDWREVYLYLALITGAIILPTALVLRPAPVAPADAPVSDPVESAGMSARQAVFSAPFIVLMLTNFFCCATHSGPIFHTVSYAIFCGIPALTAVTIYSVEGIAGMGGRIGFGVMADRFGAKRILVIGLLAQAFGALGYAFAGNLAAFYSVAAIFGFIYAGIMPLYAVLIRENFPMRLMGTLIGGTSMAGSLGMATGPLFGGWIFDRFGDYAWMYIACFGMGLGAAFIAMLFKPFPKAEPLAQAA